MQVAVVGFYAFDGVGLCATRTGGQHFGYQHVLGSSCLFYIKRSGLRIESAGIFTGDLYRSQGKSSAIETFGREVEVIGEVNSVNEANK